jgi:amidase
MQISRRGLMTGAGSITLAGCAHAPRDALGDADAVGLAARIRTGEVSAIDAAEAAIARAERMQPELNFIATPLYAEARARAANGAPSGPFAGVPTLIKDMRALKGARFMMGSRAYADFIAPAQPPYVDALLAAGLNPIGKSTTPEFGFTATTEPLLTGATRNPWNPEHSSGGSSGGSAAAVAAGVVPVADASDGGGSIRIPASCCGLVGLKVSRGRTLVAHASDEGPITLSVVGCLSRSVRDTAAWLAMMERTGADQVYPPVGLVSGPATRRLRIGLAIRSAVGQEPDPAVRAAVEGVAELCGSLGHQVRETVLNFDGGKFARDFTAYWAWGASDVVADIERQHPGTPLDTLVEPLTIALAQAHRTAPSGALDEAVAGLRAVEAAYATMFADIDVLLTPTLARPPVRIGELSPDRPETFARIGEYVAYTPLQNAAGAPSISLPLSMSLDNLPIGSMFSAAKGAERTLLELAFELERAQPWAGRRPPIRAG